MRQSWQKWQKQAMRRVLAGPLFAVLALGLFGPSDVRADDALMAEPDRAREQRMDDEIRESILDGQPLDLETKYGRSFLAIYTEASETPARGTVIVLHGRGFHPDWQTVVHPLRVGLTGHGWNTLSIQLPVLDKEAKYFDYLPVFSDAMPRIEAAIAAARERSAGRVVLLAHSCGSHMAQHWMLTRGKAATEQFDAFIGIGMGATDYGQPMQEPFALDRLSVPILDVYGDHDYPAVQRLAKDRLAALKAGGNRKSKQVVVPGDHYYIDHQNDLVEAVAAWLNEL